MTDRRGAIGVASFCYVPAKRAILLACSNNGQGFVGSSGTENAHDNDFMRIYFIYLYMIGFLPEQPYNHLSLLPPPQEQVETLAILRQESRAATALAELKGLSRLLPNPAILINALVLKEAKASSEIENIITTDDRLYRALTAKGQPVDTATKEVLRYRQALYTGHRFIKEKGFLSTNGIIGVADTFRVYPPDYWTWMVESRKVADRW